MWAEQQRKGVEGVGEIPQQTAAVVEAGEGPRSVARSRVASVRGREGWITGLYMYMYMYVYRHGSVSHGGGGSEGSSVTTCTVHVHRRECASYCALSSTGNRRKICSMGRERERERERREGERVSKHVYY